MEEPVVKFIQDLGYSLGKSAVEGRIERASLVIALSFIFVQIELNLFA